MLSLSSYLTRYLTNFINTIVKSYLDENKNIQKEKYKLFYFQIILFRFSCLSSLSLGTNERSFITCVREHLPKAKSGGA